MIAGTLKPVGKRRTGALHFGLSPALAALALALSGCARSPTAAPPSQAQPIGYAAPTTTPSVMPPAIAPPAGTDPISAGAITRPALSGAPTASSFHNILLVPYNPTSAEIEASLAVEDDMGRNPDGSFRLPPPIRIPVIDISQSYTALVTNQIFEDPHPVDISVPW